MYRKILLGGVTAAVIIGAGGTALAVTGSDSPSVTSSSSAAVHHGKHAKRRHELAKALRRVAHAQVTVRGKKGTFVTHDVIRGTVTSVSPTSVTVQAADKTTETYAVTSETKVFTRTRARSATTPRTGQRHKPTKSSIDEVTTGDRVFVAGTGTTSLSAKRVVDVKS